MLQVLHFPMRKCTVLFAHLLYKSGVVRKVRSHTQPRENHPTKKKTYLSPLCKLQDRHPTGRHSTILCVGQTKITQAILVFLSPQHENSVQMVSPWRSKGNHLLGYTQHNPRWTPFNIQTVTLSRFTD